MESFFALGVIGVIIGIVWTILCLILFAKVWGMTNDVKVIKNILLEIADNLSSNRNNENNPLGEPAYFEEGDSVVNIETGEELIVVQVFPDGDVTCKPAKGFGLRKVVRINNLKKIEPSEN